MKYQIDDLVVDTDKAQASWNEATDWNGNNHISRATGSQWEHQTLYRSPRGFFYIEHESQWQGSLPYAERIDDPAAAAWILINDGDLPTCLNEVAELVTA